MNRHRLVISLTTLALCMGPAVLSANPGQIVTVAGAGTGPLGTGNGITLSNPGSVATDRAGNLYFTDNSDHLIYRIDAATGNLTLIAGGGQTGNSGDGGPATQASIDATQLGLDASGNLYFIDGANTVRRVDANTGVIATIAGTGASSSTGDGGPATLASFNGPWGLAIDSQGNIFVSEIGGSRVRRIDASTGIITTYAGTGTAGFSGDGGPASAAALNFPVGLAVDSANNLYINEEGNERIRRVTAASGIINTVAGNGGSSFSGDGLPATQTALGPTVNVAVDAAGNLYCALFYGARVLEIPASGGPVTTIAGNGLTLTAGDGGPATSASFVSPNWIAMGANGTLFVSDISANRVRAISLPSPLTYSVTTLSVSGSGQNQSLSATIVLSSGSGYPTGSVQFFDASTNAVLGTASVNVGFGSVASNANLFTSGLPAGNHTVIAVYSGDSTYNSSGSLPASLTVAALQSTTLAFSSTTNPSTAGQNTAYFGSVSPYNDANGNVPTGTLTLLDGSTGIGSYTLVSPNFSFAATINTAGKHNLSVSYSGDSHFASSTSSVVVQTVLQSETLTLTLGNNPTTTGASNTYTVTLSNATDGNGHQPTGTVTLMDGSNAVGSAPLNGVSVPITASLSSTGQHNLTAVYSGDGNFAAASSPIYVETVKTPTTAAVNVDLNPVTAGATATFTATVSPAAATGAVQLVEYPSPGANYFVLANGTLANGGATFPISSLSAGTHLIAVAYQGDSTYLGVNSSYITEVVRTATTTALSASSGSINYGQSVNFFASVSPNTATGSVQYFDGSTSLGSATLNNGTATFSIATLTAGSHSITAVYGGDSSNGSSTSGAVAETVNQATPFVSLASSQSPVPSGQSFTLTVTVQPNSPPGNVQFLDGSSVLGTVALASGTASYSASLGYGIHSLTAVYTGSANYTSSTSNVLTEVVTTPTATTLAVNPMSTAYGQAVQLTASISPAAQTGYVQFFDGSTSLGLVNVSSGGATLTVSNLAAGSHSLKAVYAGDGAVYLSSTSSTVAATVAKASASVTLTSSLNPANVGQNIIFSASVTPSAATGTVQFLDGSTVLATVTLSSGAASYSSSALSAGTHSISAVYSGDGNYNGVTAPAVSQIVKASTTTTVTASPASAVYHQTVQLTAAVNPSAATGMVQFFDGSTSLGAATLSAGAGSLSVAAFGVGSHSITAVYSGDASDNASTSAPVTVFVIQAATSTAVTSSLNPSTSGQSVTFTATISPSAATGSVTFTDGSTSLGTAPVSGGAAAFTTGALSVASHTITATYSGDANYSGSSGSVAQTVKAALPGAPSSLNATAVSSSQINLTWTASSTSGVTYNVYSSTTAGFTPATSNKIASGLSSTTYAHTGLAASTTHYYLVTAQNSAGESGPSNQASAITQSAGLSCHVTYSVTTQWNVGFGTAITIQNTGSATINNWDLTWTWSGNQQITQAWNSNYSQSGAHASLTNASWNNSIAPGSNVSGIGFNGSYSGTNNSPSAFYLNGTLCH